MFKPVILISIAMLLIGCGVPMPTPAARMTITTIRVGFPTAPDPADVPSLLAHELLRAEGYTVEQIPFESSELQVAAMANGELDFSNGSTRTHWAAVAQGADIIMLMQQSANEWSLVTSAGLDSCSELNGKKFGVQSSGSMSNALLQAYFKLYCPDAAPELLYISGSENRAVALQAGELDGTLAEIAEQLELETQAPDKFPILINYSSALPNLKTTGIYTSDEFATANPQVVRDYLKAVLTVYRNLHQDPQPLYDMLESQLQMSPEQARQVGDEYLHRRIWDPNGGLSQDDITYSLEFFQEMGSVPKGLDPAKLINTAYLDTVLKEIGKQGPTP